MLFKSQVYTQVSGSIGGITYAHNKSGLYSRARAIPVDPASVNQQRARIAMATIVTLWAETLTAAQRTAWGTYATNVLRPNPLGDMIDIGAVGQYVRSNVIRRYATSLSIGDATIVNDGPTIFDVGSFTPVTVALDTANDEHDVTFDTGDDWVSEDDAFMYVFVSRPQNPGVNFFKGPFRLAGVIAGDSVAPPTSPAAIASPFTIVAGQAVFTRVIVSRADGRLSDDQIIRAIAP